MKNVLHIWRYYGQRSQTWLYRQLSAQANYTPHLILKPQWLHNAHPEEFPFPPDQLHHFPQHNIIHRTLSRIVTTICTSRRDTFTISDIKDINNLAQKIDAHILHIHFGWTATQLLPISNFGVGRWLLDVHSFFHPSLFTVHCSLSTILSFYGSDVFRLSPKYRKQLIRILKTDTCPAKPWRNRLQIIVTSHALKTELTEIGATAENITVIPVGIDIDEFPSIDKILKRKEKLSNTKYAKNTKINKTTNRPLKIFTVGRLVNSKAPQQLPKIAKILSDKGINYQWTVAGDGPLMEECQQAVKTLNIHDRITFIGSIPFEEVKQQMLDSDILVHNAIIAPDGSREALGVTLMEAGALGLPVVSCNIGGIPEVIINNKTGILIDLPVRHSLDRYQEAELQLTAMTNAIIKLANNPTLRQQMGKAAMHHIRKEFNAKDLARKVEEIYEKSLQ